jgi:hypothetical protein
MIVDEIITVRTVTDGEGVAGGDDDSRYWKKEKNQRTEDPPLA